MACPLFVRPWWTTSIHYSAIPLAKCWRGRAAQDGTANGAPPVVQRSVRMQGCLVAAGLPCTQQGSALLSMTASMRNAVFCAPTCPHIGGLAAAA
jgi:hypothetical protein